MTFRALSAVIPDRCPAGGYQLTGGFFFRVDPRDGPPFICIDPLGGGNGGQPGGDGPTLMMFPNGDVPNTPVEVLESRYPAVRVERFAFRTDGVGAGLHRGGMGVVREYRILEGGVLMQTVTENTRDQLGKGVGGGGIGGQPSIVIRPDSEDELRLTERVTYFGPLEAGVRVRVLSPGGGGWGDPRRRDPEQVARDVRDELMSAEEAREVFGVVLAADGSA